MKLACLIVFSLFVSPTMAASLLFSDGRTDYVIVVDSHASASEKAAAQELQMYISQAGGVTLPIVATCPADKFIHVGWTSLTERERPADNDEGYTYFTRGNNLFIYGGSKRGTLYGVCSFLEREMGIHWYTGSYTKVPRLRRFSLTEMDHSEQPAFELRLDYFNDAVMHKEWAMHNLMNTHPGMASTKLGPMEATWGVHTFSTLIPPEKYFNQHPEYFSLYNGKRSDDAQLCLANKQMRDELVRNLKTVIRENPGYWCYDVSQNDNNRACECVACQELVTHWGGQSGAMIWFVNQVTEEINKTWPDVMIGTFAYRYTRQAPTSGIRPARNVVVKLCDIECCMAHPLDACEQNKSFLRDMDDWRRITQNIYVWDYTTDFHHYLMPFPNFDVLASNYQYFRRSHVRAILELGSWDAPWGEFSELKQWLVAKLLWNPRQDTDSLARLFINDYYGPAARHVWKYYDMCRRLVTKDTHFTVYVDCDTELFNDRFVADAQKVVKKAVAASRDPETLKRTRRLAAQVYYMQLRCHAIRSLTDGTSDTLREIIKSDSTFMREHKQTVDQLIHDLSYY